MKWLSSRKLKSLTSEMMWYKSRYEKLKSLHCGMIKCSPKCACIMREKREAKLSWLEALLRLKEYKQEIKIQS